MESSESTAGARSGPSLSSSIGSLDRPAADVLDGLDLAGLDALSFLGRTLGGSDSPAFEALGSTFEVSTDAEDGADLAACDLVDGILGCLPRQIVQSGFSYILKSRSECRPLCHNTLASSLASFSDNISPVCIADMMSRNPF